MNNAPKPYTIFVSGASGIVGYGILKSLRAFNPKIKLIGATIYEDSVAPAFCDVFEKAPFTTSNEYFPWLLGIIKKHSVDMIIPSIEADMIAWNEHRAELENACTVLLNNAELINFCTDKWLFYEKLSVHNPAYAIPTSLTLQDAPKTYPFLLKPRRGFASQGIVKVENKNMLLQYKDEIGQKLMLQPIIGMENEEYSVSAFFNKNSELCAYMSIKRTLSKEGFTEKAQTIEATGTKQCLLELASTFKPIGPTNFQFRVKQGQLKLLEINPRISSATSLRTAFNYNESAMCVHYFLNQQEIAQPVIKHGHAIRYTEDMVFYDSSDI